MKKETLFNFDDLDLEFQNAVEDLESEQIKSLLVGIYVMISETEKDKNLPAISRKSMIKLTKFVKENTSEDGLFVGDRTNDD